jgi:hypothetical protein
MIQARDMQLRWEGSLEVSSLLQHASALSITQIYIHTAETDHGILTFDDDGSI